MASSPDRTHIDSTIYADIKARRFIGRPDALRCCRRYSWNFAVTNEIEPIRDENVAASERPGPVLGKPFLTALSLPRFVVIGGGRRLGLLAGKLSADSFCNPQNARVERFACARAVVVGWMNAFPFLFRRHSNIPSSGAIGQKATKRRKAEVGKLHYRIMA
jgi:hypothetical protein